MSMEVIVKVEVVRRGETEVKVRKGERIESVMRRLGLNPVEYVAVLEGEVVPEDEVITKPVRLRLIPVVSGG